MKRGFEHRLWGYKVVKIQQPDAERGTPSHSTSSIRSHSSSSASLNDRGSGEYGNLGTVESSEESGLAQHSQDLDQEKGEYARPENAEPTIRPVPESREKSEDTEEREKEGDWQIPETVILTSESISPF